MPIIIRRPCQALFRKILGVAVLLLLGFFAWSPGLSGPYLFDDFVTPLNDPASQSVASWIKNMDVTLRPLTKATYAMESEFGFTQKSWMRRILSLLFHSCAAVLFFLLIKRIAPEIGWYRSVAIAAIWLLHPVHADSVLLVSGRTAALAALFIFGALFALEQQKVVLAIVCFLLGILSRETTLAAVLPLVVAAISHPTAQRKQKLHAAASFIAVAGIGLLWCLAVPRYRELLDYSLHGRPLVASIVSQIAALPIGLGLLFNPAALSIDYGVALPVQPMSLLFLAGILCYCIAFIAMIVALRASQRSFAIGLSLWLAALLPTQSVIPKLDPITNRPLSLALAGLLLASLPFVIALQKKIRSRGNLFYSSAFVALIVVISCATWERSKLFRSELALWRDAASKSKTNSRPHLQYAILLQSEGREREAYRAIQKARAMDPFSSRIDSVWKEYENKRKKETQ